MNESPDDIKDYQRKLFAAGFDPGAVDGVWGPKTDVASNQYEASLQNPPKADAAGAALPSFDPRSEKNIATLLPPAQIAARKFLAAVLAAGMDARIISGNRTWKEQDALYDQGRTQPGKIVTNAPGGYSNHNFGIAWDIGIFVNGQYLDDSPDYQKAGAIGQGQGLEWGGTWVSIKDEPHFNLKTNYTVAQLRQMYLAGKAYV